MGLKGREFERQLRTGARSVTFLATPLYAGTSAPNGAFLPASTLAR
jgi:hypothetical protein